jgi:hypothetical protein
MSLREVSMMADKDIAKAVNDVLKEQKAPKTEKVKADNKERAPQRDGERLAMNNATIKDIRDNLFEYTGLRNLFKTKAQVRTLKAVIDEAVNDDRYISRDGTYTMEMRTADDILARGREAKDVEVVAMAYAVLQLRRLQEKQREAFVKAHEENDPLQAKLWQDLQETQRLIELFTRASKEGATQSARNLRIRRSLLSEEDFTEEGILAKLNETAKKRGYETVKLTDQQSKEVRRLSAEYFKLKQKYDKAKADLKLKGKASTMVLVNGVIQDIKKNQDKKDLGNKIRLTKNLNAAIEQLDDVLNGKICD